MKLLNFTLQEPNNTIVLHALGLNWDLHNFAVFQSLHLTDDGSAVLTWQAPDEPNPWGDPSNTFKGCQLRFQGVLEIRVCGRDSTMPTSESSTLADLSKVIPEPGEYRQLVDWPPEAPFNLLFSFQSGLSIEIAAEQAELRPLPRATERSK